MNATELTTQVQELPIVEHDGQRVVTFAQIDELHQRAKGTSKRTYNRHKGRLLEGVDYWEICGDEIRTLNLDAMARTVILVSESGYLMLVKSFQDDLAWDVQRALVNHYFKPGAPKNVLEQLLAKSVSINQQLADTQVTHGESINRIETKVDRLGDRVTRIEQAATSHRKEFGKRAINAAMACLDDKYNRGGKIVCPCCDQPTVEFEFHHWHGKGGNSCRILLPLHPDCHKAAETEPGWHDSKQSEFNIWQKHAEAYFRAGGLIAGAQREPVQPSLFGDSENFDR